VEAPDTRRRDPSRRHQVPRLLDSREATRPSAAWQQIGQPVADQLRQAITTARRDIDRLESEELIQRLDWRQAAPELGFEIER
jgi:hypothetical protein